MLFVDEWQVEAVDRFYRGTSTHDQLESGLGKDVGDASDDSHVGLSCFSDD